MVIMFRYDGRKFAMHSPSHKGRGRNSLNSLA